MTPRSVLALSLVFGACGFSPRSPSPAALEEAWNSKNNPSWLNQSYEFALSRLPRSGRLDRIPWPDTYWPSNEGGIASRWNDDGDGFAYRPPSLQELQAMSRRELGKLSPAEKYDIFMGDYSYPTVRTERGRTSPENESWEGLCHGWAPSSLNFSEPRPFMVKNRDGIAIPFGSADVKALLAFAHGVLRVAPTALIGERCNQDVGRRRAHRSEACRDVNAGSFHVVLANQIGLMNKGFIADLSRGKEVWNQPIYGFTSTIEGEQRPSRGAARGTVKEIRVRTEMEYASESGAVWEAQNAGAESGITVEYRYNLELDGQGRIIGGSWNGDDRPDFLWIQAKPSPRGYYAGIRQLHALSEQGGDLENPSYR